MSFFFFFSLLFPPYSISDGEGGSKVSAQTNLITGWNRTSQTSQQEVLSAGSVSKRFFKQVRDRLPRFFLSLSLSLIPVIFFFSPSHAYLHLDFRIKRSVKIFYFILIINPFFFFVCVCMIIPGRENVVGVVSYEWG